MIEGLGYLMAIITILAVVSGIASLVKSGLRKLQERSEPTPPPAQKTLNDEIYDFLMRQNYFPSREKDIIRFRVNDIYMTLHMDETDPEFFALSVHYAFDANNKKLARGAYKLTRQFKVVKIFAIGNDAIVRIEFFCGSLDYFVQYFARFFYIIRDSFQELYEYCHDVEDDVADKTKETVVN